MFAEYLPIDILAESPPVPATCNAELYPSLLSVNVVPISKRPSESMRSLSLPAVVTASVSAAGLLIQVFVSASKIN